MTTLIDLGTLDGQIAWVRRMTDTELRTLADADTTPARLALQCAADGEMILRATGHHVQIGGSR